MFCQTFSQSVWLGQSASLHTVKQVTGSTLRLLRVTHNIALWYTDMLENLWLSTIEPLGVVNCAYSTITELILDFLLHPWNSCHSSVRLLLTPCMTFTCEIMMALHLNACPDAASSSSPLKRSLWVDFYPLPPPKVSPEPDLCPWGVG